MPEVGEGLGVPQTPVAKLSNTERKETEGLRMDFRINNRHLIKHTIACVDDGRFSSQEPREDLVAFQDSARKELGRCYDFIAGRASLEQFTASGGTLEKVTGFLTKIEQGNEFGKIRQQTEIYIASLKAEWERNYPQTSQAVQEMAGVDLNKQVTIWVTHPSLKNGQFLGNNNIAWGHSPEWDNYATVYLWHEVLHSYLDYTDLSHALIQLIADNEIRTRLNEGETYPPFVGHKDLFPLMNKLLPYWHSYLTEASVEGKRDLLGFEKKLRAMPEFHEEPQKQAPATQVIE